MFCQLRAGGERWYCQFDFDSKLTIISPLCHAMPCMNNDCVHWLFVLNRTNVTSFFATKIKYFMYNVQGYNVHCNNPFCPVVCEDWHFDHTWRALTYPHHFTKRGGRGLGP